jgi:hypothetical protein
LMMPKVTTDRINRTGIAARIRVARNRNIKGPVRESGARGLSCPLAERTPESASR